jgi:hypothetical protein
LLEHDFGDPDGVRIAGAPPRQVAGIGGEPVEQRWNQPVQIRSSELGVRSSFHHATELLPQKIAKAAKNGCSVEPAARLNRCTAPTLHLKMEAPKTFYVFCAFLRLFVFP